MGLVLGQGYSYIRQKVVKMTVEVGSQFKVMLLGLCHKGYLLFHRYGSHRYSKNLCNSCSYLPARAPFILGPCDSRVSNTPRIFSLGGVASGGSTMARSNCVRRTATMVLISLRANLYRGITAMNDKIYAYEVRNEGHYYIIMRRNIGENMTRCCYCRKE